MKRKIKILLLLLISFTLSGCAIHYDVVINDDMSVNEMFDVTMKGNQFEEDPSVNESTKQFVTGRISSLDDKNLYTRQMIIEKNRYGGSFYRSYSNINEYITASKAISILYEGIEEEVNGSIVSLKSKGKFQYDNLYLIGIDMTKEQIENSDEFTFNIDDAYLSIKLPFKVTHHNADKVKNNRYYWYFDQNTTDKNIELTFDKGVKVNSNFFTNFNYNLLLIIVFIVIIVIVGSKIKDRYNSRDQI